MNNTSPNPENSSHKGNKSTIEIESCSSPSERRFEEAAVFLDVAMLVILGLNLTILMANTLLELPLLVPLFEWLSPNYMGWYETYIQPNFVLIELSFIGIYLTELIVRWGLAIHLKTHKAWWLYPVTHWYDVLGMLPIQGFILFRLIRVWVIALRLHRIGMININNWLILRTLNAIIQAFITEVSDRVSLNLIARLERQIEQGNGYSEHVYETLIEPRQGYIAHQLAQRLDHMVNKGLATRQEQIDSYIKKSVMQALEDNPDIDKIRSLPLIGEGLVKEVEGLLTDLLQKLQKQFVGSLTAEENAETIEHAISDAIEGFAKGYKNEDEFIKAILIDVLGQLNEQIEASRQRHYFNASNTPRS